MFPNGAGKPIGMQRVVQDIIRPALKGSGIEWHGWHALRRGLATNLYDLGVPDRIIQLAKTQRDGFFQVPRFCYLNAFESPLPGRQKVGQIRGCAAVARGQYSRVIKVVQKLGIARSRDFDTAGINRKFVAIAVKNGLILKLDRGTYAAQDFVGQPHARLIGVCKRIPESVVCLQSAAHFHGLIDHEPEKVWIAIDEKSWDPSVDALQVRRVWFSGAAMTQGVVNRRIDGATIRVYSPMKTIADLFKYRNKVRIEVALEALRASIRTNQYSPYRLLHFARICRVEKLAASCIRQVGSGREFEGRQLRSSWKQRV